MGNAFNAIRTKVSSAGLTDTMQELRNLDERTEYLRRTYTSLRAGRRNLHARICQYLRFCREAGINYPAILQHEEALAELDASIDEWVIRLDKAENRRIRVRQKLLEHVAVAAILLPAPEGQVGTALTCSLEQAAGGMHACTICDISTPPRSPTKPSRSPERAVAKSASPPRVVAQVPSTIFEQHTEDDDEAGGEKALAAEERVSRKGRSTTSLKRADLESIRIYAGDGLYSLLTNVDNEIPEMVTGVDDGPGDATVSDGQRREISRLKSEAMLTGSAHPQDAAAPLPPAQAT